jgi:nitroreductase
MKRHVNDMTPTQTGLGTRNAALRRTAVRATRAPSVHNTQPWRFVLGPDVLEIHADMSRQLMVLDPWARQLLLSCGCAVFNARAALASSGLTTTVERFPDPTRPDLVARFRAVADRPIDEELAQLDAMIEIRRTNRRYFDDEPVPASVVDVLSAAAQAEGAQLFPIVRTEHRSAVARLSQLADRLETADPAYRAELRAWTTDDPARVDGVPAYAVSSVNGPAHDDIPIRDFDTAGTVRSATTSSRPDCLLLLGTNADNPSAWERAGEALERVLLEVTRLGYTSSPLTQIIEIPRTRGMLRDELGLSMFPHVLLRVGRAPETPLTRRRRLVDVLTEHD